MGSAISSLFGRDFVIGFFLPGAAFVALFTAILAAVGMSTPEHYLPTGILAHLTWTELKSFISETSMSWMLGGFLVSGLLVAVILSSVNYLVFRFFEGYGRWNPLGLLKPLRHRTFKALQRTAGAHERLAELNDPAARDPKALRRFSDALTALATRFPDEFESAGLGTRFGNVVRAAEVYSRVMYGIEGVQGWMRLVAVIPKDYMAFVSSARAQIDLSLNMAVVLWLCVTEYVLLCAPIYGAAVHQYPYPSIPLVLILWAWVAVNSAESAAVTWGNWVRSAFDVFLGDLRSKLDFDPFDNADAERVRWSVYSQAIIYRVESMMPRRSAVPDESPDPPRRSTGFFATVIDRLLRANSREP